MSTPTGPLTLVIGGTGGCGKFTVLELLRRNYAVRLLVRDLPTAEKWFPNLPIQYAEGDALDAQSLVKAFAGGVTYLIICIGSKNDKISFPRFGGQYKPQDPFNLDYKAMEKICIAAKAAGTVKHVVLVSSSFCGMPWSLVSAVQNFTMQYSLAYKILGEEVVRKSGIPYSIVRPSVMTAHIYDNLVNVGSTGSRMRPISKRLVGQILVQCLEQEDAKGRTFECWEETTQGKKVVSLTFENISKDSKPVKGLHSMEKKLHQQHLNAVRFLMFAMLGVLLAIFYGIYYLIDLTAISRGREL
jgi:nucleoside-diphosphate-sugar epimerase